MSIQLNSFKKKPGTEYLYNSETILEDIKNEKNHPRIIEEFFHLSDALKPVFKHHGIEVKIKNKLWYRMNKSIDNTSTKDVVTIFLYVLLFVWVIKALTN